MSAPQNLTELLNGPALEPPVGVEPNFENNGGLHAVGYFVVIFCSIISTLALAFRITSRIALRRIRNEDICLVIAFGLFIAYEYPIYQWAIYPGIKVHQWNMPFKDLTSYLYGVHLASIFYGVSIMFLKVAILLDWLHIFVPTQRNAFFWLLHILIWSNILFFVAGTVTELFRCLPREKIWEPLFEGGFCGVNIEASNMASGIINLISDIAVLLTPQWVIWNLHMSFSKKIGMSMLFTIGVFATACGIVRLVILLEIMKNPDQLYLIPDVGLWGIGEMTAGFLIIGIPSVPKVVNTIMLSHPVKSLMSTWLGSSPQASKQESSPRRRQYWSLKRRGPWSITGTEFDEEQLVTMNSAHPVQIDVPDASAQPGYRAKQIPSDPSVATLA